MIASFYIRIRSTSCDLLIIGTRCDQREASPNLKATGVIWSHHELFPSIKQKNDDLLLNSILATPLPNYLIVNLTIESKVFPWITLCYKH